MNRRKLLKSMLAMPALGMMGGCHWSKKDGSNSNPSRVTTLRIILQGPFAVVLLKDQGFRIKAFVPYWEGDDFQGTRLNHEFLLGTPLNRVEPPKTLCRFGYQFTLSDHGLAATPGQPYIDRGFDRALLRVGPWEPRPEDYFVSLDLPAPYAISYIPPLYPVKFRSDHPSPSDYAQVPFNHVLEYRLADAHDVRIQQSRVEWCGEGVRSYKLEDRKPLSCTELYNHYQDYWKNHEEQRSESGNHELSERPYIERDFESCSFSTYFFGVGLPAGPDYDKIPHYLADHGIDFYNHKLLPAIYEPKFYYQPGGYGNEPQREQGKRLRPPGIELEKIGPEARPPCLTSGFEHFAPEMAPAGWQYSVAEPHLRYVTNGQGCTVHSATVIVDNTCPNPNNPACTGTTKP